MCVGGGGACERITVQREGNLRVRERKGEREREREREKGIERKKRGNWKARETERERERERERQRDRQTDRQIDKEGERMLFLPTQESPNQQYPLPTKSLLFVSAAPISLAHLHCSGKPENPVTAKQSFNTTRISLSL